MDVWKRSVRYLIRKKGKNMLLFLIFFLVSAFLLICFLILDGTEQAAKDLRSNIGAAFYIRPYAQMNFDRGEVSEGAAPVVTQQSIEEIISAAGGILKTYNTEHYGYAKSSWIHFLPGTEDSAENNMGRVTAVRDSELMDVFLNKEYTLISGRHIRPEDDGKILISAELAAENDLKIGDVITLTHAGLGQQDGSYMDTIPEKTAFADAEIVGIFQCDGAVESADAPTAGKAVNHIISDGRLLVHLQEQPEGVYEGEISFYVTDPLALDDFLERVAALDSIDWENHILRENDFEYTKIAGQLQKLQHLAMTFIVAASALSIAVLMLILSMRIRGRIREAGIYLAVGKTKAEIIGQFAMETGLLLTLGFLTAVLLTVFSTHKFGGFMFGDFINETALPLSAGDYMKPDALRYGAVFAGALGAVLVAVVLTGSIILRLKPKEILTKMS